MHRLYIFSKKRYSINCLTRFFGKACIFITLFFCGCENGIRNSNNNRFRPDETGRVVPTNNEGRFQAGRYIRSDYEGELCNDTEDHEREECQEKCNKVYGRDADKCEVLPVDLIQELEKLVEHLESPQQIKEGENSLHSQVDEYSFGVMIDISIEPMLRLIRQWNSRHAKEFLIWLAQSPDAAAGIREHDTEYNILTQVFGKVVSYPAVADVVKYGLAADLRGFGETFLVLADVVKNDPAFALIHDLIGEFCSSTGCKLQHYCMSIKNERSPSHRNHCAYYRSSRVIFSNVGYCYIHGPNVWNNWNKLHRDGSIVDDMFNKNFEITSDVCKSTCINISLCERRE